MNKFCDELRAERERREISVETICATTKVSLRHVQALEAGNYSELPGGVFRKGILRSYLGVLGMEEGRWVERFDVTLREEGVTTPEGADWVEFAENVKSSRAERRPRTGPRWLGVVGMTVVLAGLAWAVWSKVIRPRIGLSTSARISYVMPGPDLPVREAGLDRTIG